MATQHPLLSPKNAALALGVSESSLKRWCDRGDLPASRTAGGHRRIARDDVMKFARARGMQLANAGALGMNNVHELPARGRALMVSALLENREAEALELALRGFIHQVPIAELCDTMLAPAMHEIGARWDHGKAEIYEERRACNLMHRIIDRLRMLVPVDAVEAPVALGGTLAPDPYSLPLAMAELTLRDAGWNAVSLGIGHPPESLVHSIERERPALFFYSATSIETESKFVAGFNRIGAAAEKNAALMLIGGQAITDGLRDRLIHNAVGRNFADMARIARTVWSRTGVEPANQQSG